MAQFRFVAKNNEGLTVKGKEYAVSESELITRLSHRNLIIISITEVRDTGIPPIFRFGIGRVGNFDLIVFCKQLATMVKGGVPLLRSIESIALETKNAAFADALRKIKDNIRDGDSFSQSIGKFPYIFSKLFVTVVEAGEKAGVLDTMLERLSNYFTARNRINKKILTAIAYPSFIVFFFIVAIAFITLFLIPRFKLIYQGFGAKLPTPTLVVFGISDFIIRYFPFMIVALAALIFILYFFFFRTTGGKYIFDGMLLRLPVMGEVVRKAAISKFARTFATLLSEGIAVTEAIELVGKTSGNVVIEKAALKASSFIMNGDIIPEALRKTRVFPPLLIQMATVGVESGNLPELLDKTADFYEDQVDTFIATATAMIESVLIVVLGVVLGTVIVTLYLPIFKLGSAMSGR